MSESPQSYLPEAQRKIVFNNAAGNEMEENKSFASALGSEDSDVNKILLRRVPIVICVVVALDWLLLGRLSSIGSAGKFRCTETILAIFVGLLVIIYYEWRWSEAVAKRLEAEPGLLDSWSLEKILLLIAGFVFLIPGVATDFLAVLMLMPGIRQTIVNLFQLCL